jgi:hypothetical protein
MGINIIFTMRKSNHYFMNYRALLFTVVFWLFLSGMAFTQEWKPLTSNEKFNYRIDSAGYISTTLWIDSIKIMNGDSVFFLNR